MLQPIFTRYWNSKVLRYNDEVLIAQTHYCDDKSELIITFRVNAKSFVIEQASVEKYLSSGKMCVGPINIDGVQGLVAYIGNGSQFKKVMRENGMDPVTSEIFNDTIRALIQAETFIITERGFNSMLEYSGYWERMYLNSCRYYSNLDKIKSTWFDHVNNQHRGNVLYNRFKSQLLFLSESDNFSASGNIIDTFHNMSVFLDVNKTNHRIANAEATMVRVLDQVCSCAASEMKNLFEHDVCSLSKKQIANLLGAKQGCVHLIDLVNDSVETLKLYLSA